RADHGESREPGRDCRRSDAATDPAREREREPELREPEGRVTGQRQEARAAGEQEDGAERPEGRRAVGGESVVHGLPKGPTLTGATVIRLRSVIETCKRAVWAAPPHDEREV